MLKSISSLLNPALTLALLIFSGACLATDSREQRDHLYDDAVRRLAKEGIRPHDEGALIQCLKRDDRVTGSATAAAYVLGRLPKTENSVRALNEVLVSPNDFTLVYAVRALLKLGETEWVPTALERLRKLPIPQARVHLAGLLAEAGHYEGWDIIVDVIKTAGRLEGGLRADPADALLMVRHFKGMKTPDGKPVDLIAELKMLEYEAAESIRPLIRQQINQLVAPPPARGVVPKR